MIFWVRSDEFIGRADKSAPTLVLYSFKLMPIGRNELRPIGLLSARLISWYSFGSLHGIIGYCGGN